MISFNCLIVLANTSGNLMNKYGKSAKTCFVPAFSGIALIFLHYVNTGYMPNVNSLFYVDVCSFYS